MKKISTSLLTLLCLLFVFGLNRSTAQNKSDEPFLWLPNPSAEMAPGITPGPPGPAPLALFDVQFVYNTSDSTGYNGMAGVAFTGTEFWVSRWASDTIFTFSPTGTCTDTFTIPTLSGVRAFTWDGTTLYATNNTNKIYKINPATKTLTGNITVGMTNTRHCTYDPTANSGGGGFWIGNFNTDLELVDMNGNLLASIAAGTHTLTSMYGTALDTVTSGGPYLWVFHQGGTSASNIARLQLPGGTPTLATHDVMTDVGPLGGATSGLAGGLFITDQLVGGQWTLCGLLQGTPDNLLFGYELNDYVPPAVDATMDSLFMILGYTKIPEGHASNLSMRGNIRNSGLNTLNTVNFNLTVKQGASTVFTDTQSSTNLASNANVSLNSAAFSVTNQGLYNCYGVATLTGQTDLVSSNDSLIASFQVTDSTYSRDNAIDNGNAYNVGGTEWAWVTSNFTIPVSDTLTSVSITLIDPLDGDTTYAVVVETAQGTPGALIAQSLPVIISAVQNDYVLVFPNGVGLNAGEYAIGVYEGDNTAIGLAQSSSVFTPGVNWVFQPSSGWFPSGIQTSRFIRPNFGNPSVVGIEKPIAEKPVVTVFPNPAHEMIHLQSGNATILSVKINNLLGETLLNPGMASIASGISIADLSNGIYLVEVTTDKGNIVEKIAVAR